MARFILLVLLFLAGSAVVSRIDAGPQTEARRDLYLRQLENDDSVPEQIRADYTRRNAAIGIGATAWCLLAVGLYYRDLHAWLRRPRPTTLPEGRDDSRRWQADFGPPAPKSPPRGS